MFCYILSLVLGSVEAPLVHDSYSSPQEKESACSHLPGAGTTAEPSGQVAVRDSKPKN